MPTFPGPPIPAIPGNYWLHLATGWVPAMVWYGGAIPGFYFLGSETLFHKADYRVLGVIEWGEELVHA